MIWHAYWSYHNEITFRPIFSLNQVLEDYSFATLPALEVLHLHFNKLTNLGNETFNETYNIKFLTIYNNSLKEIPG